MPRHASPVQSLLVDDLFDADVYFREPMSKHTTFRIGGQARFYVRVNSMGALAHLLDACIEERMPWMVVGRGSNLLVSDDGFDGAIITLGRDFRNFRWEDDHYVAGAGVALSSVVQDSFSRSLSGFEFATGTPGTIGGALCMNAGTRDTWIGHRVLSVTTYQPGRGFLRRLGNEIEWNYRSTSLDPQEVVVECELSAQPADPFAVRDRMEENLARRKRTQPLSSPSCGSVFKNPLHSSAARLLDEAGLKGVACGGARVSNLHSNFIVNEGAATAQDVLALMHEAQKRVAAQTGITLELEVRLVGFSEEGHDSADE